METLDYQLKWAQHQCNLNSNIASLYRNSKYADVMLLCEEQSIPCHKIVLSSTSMYFASIFEKLPQMSVMPIIYIVLPPDLTYQAMKILIHYMYRGESRVSNDILKEVLHAGDVLKVRGLYRGDSAGKENKAEKPKILCPSTSHHPTSNIPQQIHAEAPQKVVSVISSVAPTPSHVPQKDTFHKVPCATRRPSIEQHTSTKISVPKTHVTHQQSHLVNFLTTIKEEPVEWSDEFTKTAEKIKCHRGMYIKTEEIPPQGTHFQKLSCEICKEDFILPADWVRHVKRHAETNIPTRKRRRTEDLDLDDENTASLRCDLCATYFITPGEWVKHVQSRHTEMELAVENEKLSHTASTSSSSEETGR
ncbi:uncharacterized protein LOC134832456 [Culicoides brevitarsis]|uniref:uncharacterized protein LOC134832456 n=1 Tax=Culicoides brevitarsis TaxID=469753 RepID=UPI00307C196F